MHFDSHLHFDALKEAPDAVVARAVAAGVTRMIAIGGDDEANAFAIGVAEAHPEQVRATVGYDRDIAGGAWSETAIRDLAARSEVVAIGETGLDYYYSADTAPAQRELFTGMLNVARETQLPVVVHSRDADADTLALLGEHVAAWTGDAARIGILHCFTRSKDFARQVLDLGLHISFSGITTFKSAPDLREIAAFVPSDRLLIETDSPYLAPVPMRGKKNEPAYVVHVSDCIAHERRELPASIARASFENASALFAWPAT